MQPSHSKIRTFASAIGSSPAATLGGWRGAKMGMQCKSATIPVAVSSFLVQPTVSLNGQSLAPQGVVEVWEDRAVTRTKSEDLPRAIVIIGRLRDYGR